MSDPLPFALPDITELEIDAVAEALRSGWITSGPRAREFEEAFAATLGAGLHAVAVNSATAGLHLALEAIGVGPGDEVLVPTWTFTATAEVVRYLGADPVLVDVRPDTLNVDLEAASARVTKRTRAIIPVHFAGHPVDPIELASFARVHGLKVVEDAAHAFPAGVDGLAVGGGGSEATVFSFYSTKTMTTGEGGMLITPLDDVAKRARTMRLHGIDRDAFNRYRSTRPAWAYDVLAPGFKYNLTDPAAAMGLVQLRRSGAMQDRRQEIARQYRAGLADTSLELPVAPRPGVEHAWHLFVVRVPEGYDRSAFIDRMFAHGVSCSVHFIPLHHLSYWRNELGHAAGFPVADREHPRTVSLPLYSAMSDTDIDRVLTAVKSSLS